MKGHNKTKIWLKGHNKTKMCYTIHRQQSIVPGVTAMNQKGIELTRTKFETAYFVAKEEMPLKKYTSKLLNNEERHGVHVRKAYRNENTGVIFIDAIGESLATDLKNKIDEVHFYSILTHGSTDSATSENEAVFVVF